DGRKAWRQRTAGHDMLRPDLMGSGVEIFEVAGPDIHGADTEPHLARIQAIEIHHSFQRLSERADVIEAFLFNPPLGVEKRRKVAWREEAQSPSEYRG